MIKKLLYRYRVWRDRRKKIRNLIPRIEAIMKMREELYMKYLEADRQDNNTETEKIDKQLKTIDWFLHLGKIIIIIGMLTTTAFAQTNVRIEDRTTTGNRANVDQIGSKYGLVTTEGPAGTVYNGQKTTNAGTELQLSATSVPIKSVSVKALTTNTGIVYVGNSSVTSANGYELKAGEAIDIDINNLTGVYFDVSVNGEGVSYIGVN